jgi:hypothetical protein
MTRILFASFAAALCIPFSLALANEAKTREVVVSVSDAYLPSGFDSSYDAYVVVSGLFPNSCYRLKETRTEHIGPALHEVSTYATVTEGLCLMVLLPFNKEASLGKL